MNDYKKINRNVFNEKIIHRYLLEKYYFSSKKEINNLLPDHLKGEDINLIVPEKNSKDNYRADLTIYFKGREKGIPIEVKWRVRDLKKSNQVNYLKRNNGFLASFTKKDNFVIPSIKINYQDFQKWLSLNISRLIRRSISFKMRGNKFYNNRQNWLVFLRGSALNNFRKMLDDSDKSSKINSSFWAFEQHRKALKNILEMNMDDNIIFILGKATEGMGVSDNPKLDLFVSDFYIGRIKEPYYMVLKGEKGTFFERGDIIVNKRRWPHFIDFKISKPINFKKFINFGKRGEFSTELAHSYNHGHGTPVPLTQYKWEKLLDKIHYISENIENKFKK